MAELRLLALFQVVTERFICYLPDIQIKSTFRRTGVPPCKNGVYKPSRNISFNLRRLFSLFPELQIDYIRKVEGILRPNHFGNDKAGRLNDHDEPFEIRFVHKLQNTFFQALK